MTLPPLGSATHKINGSRHTFVKLVKAFSEAHQVRNNPSGLIFRSGGRGEAGLSPALSLISACPLTATKKRMRLDVSNVSGTDIRATEALAIWRRLGGEQPSI